MRIIVSTVLMGIALPLGLLAQQAAEPRRVRTNAQPILRQLEAADQHVVLEINAAPPMALVPGPGETMASFRLKIHDVVLAARIEGKRTGLVHRRFAETPPFLRSTPAAADQANWVVSNVRVRIERTIKSSPVLPIQDGATLQFDEDGGTTTVGNARVDAVVPWIRPLVVGQRYLLFGRIEEGRFVMEMAYEEPSGGATLRTITSRDDGNDGTAALDRDEIEQLQFEGAVRHLEDALARGNKK